MKKRSLVAALAMLVVSAIVLTSSTYAWFASSSTAHVNTFEAKVTNNKGALTVQATGTEAVTGAQKRVTLTNSDYKENALATTLTPVSVYIDENNAVAAGEVTYADGKYTGYTGAEANQQYLRYSFLVEFQNDAESTGADVVLQPTWSTSTDKAFCYGLIEVSAADATDSENSTYYLYSAGGYTPVSGIVGGETGSVKDTGSNADIIDPDDEGYDNATKEAQLTSVDTVKTGSDSITIMEDVAANALETVKITVYVWAEGQDPQCSGTVNAQNSSFTFELVTA